MSRRRLRIIQAAAMPFPSPQGSQVYLRGLARALARRGHDVTVACYAHGLGEADASYRVVRTPPVPGYCSLRAGPDLIKPWLDLALAVRLAGLSADLVHAHNYEAPLAAALVAGGLPVLEVTLRTEAALDAIRAMAAVPGGIVGAGTVLNQRDAEAAKSAGAGFAVSPGATPGLLEACAALDLPLLAGAVTASEVMALLERGYRTAKFFPAGTSGGAPALKALAAPLPQMTFCPTGGVSLANAPGYLALPNVACVGGSWVAPQELIAAGDWAQIEALAREAATL